MSPTRHVMKKSEALEGSQMLWSHVSGCRRWFTSWRREALLWMLCVLSIRLQVLGAATKPVRPCMWRWGQALLARGRVLPY